MAANKTNEIVLVTGVTGFIGAHVARELLERGYSVRGAVRSTGKGQGLRDGPFATFGNRFSFVVVPDIEIPGAFDVAVVGVHAIVHLASPVTLGGGDPNVIIGAAKNGTLTILQSAYDHAGPQLSRFVLASSIASLMRAKVPPKHVFTEKDWSLFTEKLVKRMGPELNQMAYYASKPIAERAFWDFIKANKPNWSVSAIHPGVVFGPYIHPVPNAEELNDTVKTVWDYYAGVNKKVAPTIAGGAFVDVRDCATIFAFAVDNPDVVNGKRFPVVGGYGPNQAIADILRGEYPERRGIIPEGTLGVGYDPQDWRPVGDITSFSTKSIEDATGIKWIPFDRSILDTAKCFERLPERGAKL